MYKQIMLIVLLIFSFSGCKEASKMLNEVIVPQVHSYADGKETLNNCNFNEAISIIEKNKNRLLKDSEIGLVLYFNQRYQESNTHLDSAINRYRINENKATISLSNILKKEYQGEGFDKVFLHNYKAINYLMLGDTESSRIESKNSNVVQVEEALKLQDFKDKYTKTDKHHLLLSRYEKLFNSVNPKHHPYQNPFAYYVSALLYAEDGDYSNALVDIRNAIKFSHSNELLNSKLLAYKNKKNRPSVELFFDVGQSPLKSQVKIKMDMGNGEERMAYLPSYSLEFSNIDHVKVMNSKGKELAKTTLLADVNAIKVNEFREKIPGILSMVMNEAGTSVGSKVLDKESALLAAIFKAGTAIYGQNDVSTWSSLPQKVLVASFTFNKQEKYELVLMDKEGKEVGRKPLEVSKNGTLKNIYQHYTIRDNKFCK